MKIRSVIAVAAVFSAGLSPVSAKEINMLFIGNSFTFRHDLNLLVKQVIEEGNPDLTVNTERVVFGGQSLFQHWSYYFSQSFVEQRTVTDAVLNERISYMKGFLELDAAPDEFVHFWKTVRGKPSVDDFPVNNIKRAIRDHESLRSKNPRTKWDYVVLQSWQDVCSDLNDGYAKYATLFAEDARKQGAKVILYITAPNIQNSEPVDGPQEQERVDREISVAAQLDKQLKPFAVVHVPLAINLIQQGGTDLTFCYKNDFHPNQYAAFLTANLFYAAMFHQSPEGFRFNTVTETNPKGMGEGKDPDGGEATVVFDEDTKNYLQKTAYQACMAFEARKAKPE